MKIKFKKARICNLIVIFIIAISIFLSLKAKFSLYLDDWYHLSVIKAFSEQISGWEWWHFAPYGRPYLYSPLFHLIGVFCVKVFQISPIQFIIFCHKISYPLLLFLFWMGVKSFLKEEGGLLTVLLAISFPASIMVSLMVSPATLVLIAIPWIYYFIQKRKIIPQILLLTICLYIHYGMGFMVLLGVYLYLFFYKKDRIYLSIILLPILLFSPWIIRLLRYRDYLKLSTQPLGLIIPALIWVLGILGVIISYRKKIDAGIFFSFLWICFLPWLYHYTNRFWPYASYLFCILGAIGIIEMRRRVRNIIYLFLIINLFFTPVISGSGSIFYTFYFLKNYYINWGIIPMAIKLSFSSQNNEIIDKDLRELASWIKRNTKKDEIIITPFYPDIFLGDMIYDLTSRRVTSGGWHEVKSKDLYKKIQDYNHNEKGFIIVRGVISHRCSYYYSPDPSLLRNTIYVKNFGNYFIFLRR